MKRLTALILALLLMLGMAGCGGKTGGGSLQDKLDRLPTAGETGPEQPQATETEPLATKPAATSDKREPSGAQEPGAPTGTISEDYSAFVGIYRSEQTQDGESLVLEIRAFGDFLLLEYSCWMEAYAYRVWVEEFWPVSEAINSAGTEFVTGMSQCYSPANNGLGSYWEAAESRSISLTGQSLTLQGKNGTESYTRDSALTGVHSSLEGCFAYLGGSAPGTGPVGQWEYNDGVRAAYLYFGEDGAFRYLYKQQNKPVRMLEGAWACDGDSGNIVCSAEQIGLGSDSHFLFRFWQMEENSGLIVLDSEEGGLYPLKEGVYFWSVSGQWSVRFPMERMQSFYEEAWYVEGVCLDENWEDLPYSYYVPLFFNDGSKALASANAEISARFGSVAGQELGRIWDGGVPVYHTVGYRASSLDGLDMLLIWTESDYELPDCAVYCYDREQDRCLDTAALLERLNISQTEFLETVREAAEYYFVSEYSNVSGDSSYSERLAWTVSDEAVNLDIPVYINGYGQIVVIARIGSLTDWDWHYAELYPFADTVG